MINKRKLLTIVIGVALCAVLLASCGLKDKTTETTTNDISTQEQNEITESSEGDSSTIEDGEEDDADNVGMEVEEELEVELEEEDGEQLVGGIM